MSSDPARVVVTWSRHHGGVAREARTPIYTSDDLPSPVEPKAPKRTVRGWRDMVLSLAVLLVPIMIAIGVWQYLSSGQQVNVVDPGSAITQARQADAFPVLVPHGLPAGWRSTSAETTVSGKTVTLRIGYVTPSGGFAQLVESNKDSAALLSGSVPASAAPTGSVRIGGHDWARYNGDKQRAVLALLEPNRTVLAVGQTSDDELRDLAASLN